MNVKKVMEEMKSTRDFKEKKVPKDLVEKILNFPQSIVPLFPDQNMEMIHFADGDDVYEQLQGIGGFHGIMIKAPHYLLFLSDNKENHQMNMGYSVQQILIGIQSLGVSTCWLTIPEDGEIIKEKLSIFSEKEAAALIAIGYDNNEIKVRNQFHFGENYSKANIKVVENNTSTRLSIDHIVYLEEWGNSISIEHLNEIGLGDVFHYVVLAPSSFNRQPWRMLLKDDRLYLAIRQDDGVNDELNMIDGGIVMLYVELAMKEYNILGKWQVEMGRPIEGIPSNYMYIGYFSKSQ